MKMNVNDEILKVNFDAFGLMLQIKFTDPLLWFFLL